MTKIVVIVKYYTCLPHIQTEIPEDPCSLEEMRSEICLPIKQQICHCVFTLFFSFLQLPSIINQARTSNLSLFLCCCLLEKCWINSFFFHFQRNLWSHSLPECFRSALDSVLIPCQTSWHVNPYSQEQFSVLRLKLTDVFTDFFSCKSLYRRGDVVMEEFRPRSNVWRLYAG